MHDIRLLNHIVRRVRVDNQDASVAKLELHRSRGLAYKWLKRYNNDIQVVKGGGPGTIELNGSDWTLKIIYYEVQLNGIMLNNIAQSSIHNSYDLT